MMKNVILLIGSIVIFAGASSEKKRIVECRFVTPKTSECNPYPSKFISADKITYGADRRKLITTKTLKKTKNQKAHKKSNVEDLIESHIEVLDPVRFSGSKPSPLKKTEQEIRQEELEEQQLLKLLAAYKIEREKLILQKKKKEQERLAKQKELARKRAENYATYTILKGDSIIRIAKRFGVSTQDVLDCNSDINRSSTIKIGQNMIVPCSQKKVDTVVAKLIKYRLKRAKEIEQKKRALAKAQKMTINGKKDFKTFSGKNRLRVQATAYSSHHSQTDDTPFLAAWNNKIRPGMKIIAVSRDLISKYGLGNGKRVKIQGLSGYYTVRDKMNKRYTKRIDIYMGLDHRRALRWGRQRTVIYW